MDFEDFYFKYNYYKYLMEYNSWRKKVILGLLVVQPQKPKRRHKFWVRKIFLKRKEHGHYYTLLKELVLDDEIFFNYMRMPKEKFNDLLSKVEKSISKSYVVREPVSAGERLACTLRYLASGDSMVSQSYNFRLGDKTVSSIIGDTCKAIYNALNEEVLLCSPKEEDWLAIANDFGNKWHMPHCIGAIDGKHVVQAPPNSGSTYYNYKHTFSVVLLALVDANYAFTIFDNGAQGRQSDGGTFKKSNLFHAIKESLLNIPLPSPLEENGPEVPYFFVGDEAFTLTNYMMRPYPGKFLPSYKRIFNYRLSRARRIVENAFGVMASRFRIFRKPIIASEETVDGIIKACICLHNWLLKGNGQVYCPPPYVDQEDEEGNIIPGDWRRAVTNNLGRVDLIGSHNFTRESSEIRDLLANFFMNRGAVPFQWSRAGVKPPE